MRRAGGTVICGLTLAAALIGCGGSSHHARDIAVGNPIGSPVGGSRAVVMGPRAASDPIALVTAETRNELLAVDLRSGGVRRRVAVAPDPEDIVVARVAIAVSPAARTVTLLNPDTLSVTGTLRGFTSPHIPAITPDRKYAYVTDDGAGTVTAIRLSDAKELWRLPIGPGAHHLTFSPDGTRLWIALGETARSIAILDTSNPAHPRMLRRLEPDFAVHDLLFSPDGRNLWMSAADGPEVTVIDARTLSLLFRVRVGPPPQHIAFGRAGAYLTSGYGGTIEKIDATTGRILARANAPYGSFELDTAGGYVATASLLRGTLAIYDTRLRLRRTVQLASATRDLAILNQQP
jgi:DNA-binding beta-propeller fold protein YncE